MQAQISTRDYVVIFLVTTCNLKLFQFLILARGEYLRIKNVISFEKN